MVRNIFFVCCLTLFSVNLFGEIIYNSIPFPLPGNVDSLGYEATQTVEFGNAITFGGTLRQLGTITVVMSNWAKESTYEAVGTSPGFYHPHHVDSVQSGIWSVARWSDHVDDGEHLHTLEP